MSIITSKKFKKLRMLVCLITIISLLSMNIAPAAALALDLHNNQSEWQQVVDADLSEYQGEKSPLVLAEQTEEAAEILPATGKMVYKDKLPGEGLTADALRELTLADPFAAMYDSDAAFMEKAERILAHEQREDTTESLTAKESSAVLDAVIRDNISVWEDRLDEDTLKMIQQLYEEERIDRFIVKYKENSSSIQEATDVSLDKTYDLSSAISVSGLRERNKDGLECIVLTEKVNPAEFAAQLKDAGLASEIEYIQPDFILSFSALDQVNPDYEEAGGNSLYEYSSRGTSLYEHLSMGASLRVGTGRETVKIALIDTGVDVAHSAIADRIVDSWNFIDNNSDVYDETQPYLSSHGTHIAGIIAQSSDEYVEIMPLQVFGAYGAYTSDIIAAITYAEENGVSIVNCSFGSASYNHALEEVLAESDMLFVASVGNARSDLGVEPVYPAAFALDNIISVASLNEDSGFSYYSNYSTKIVDIAALGRDVYSALPEGEYGLQSGTSMAAGFVSAAAAMVGSGDTDLSADELKDRLIKTGDRLGHLELKVKDARALNVETALLGIAQSTIQYPEYEEDYDVHGYAPTAAESWDLFAARTVVKVVGGEWHTLALCSDGSVWAWGCNDEGELGDGTTIDRLSPVNVIGLTNVVDISAGRCYSLAVKDNGTVWAWGMNTDGKLGDGTTTNRLSPVQSFITGVTSVSAGRHHSLAIKSNGTAWGWGRNTYGDLGDGTKIDRYTPVQVSGLTGVIDISACWYNHSLALKSNGTAWAFGCNSYGQLGDRTTTDRLTPVRVSGLTGITAVSGGYRYGLALKSNGTVWAWGLNDCGQLGDGTTTNRKTAVQVSGLTGVTAIIAGTYYSLALKSNGTVMAWGDNQYGQLGDGTTTDRKTAVQVSGLANIVATGAGDEHSLAIKEGGMAVWAWGGNYCGQLGDGTTTNRLTPFQVIDELSEMIHYGSPIVNLSGNMSRTYLDMSYNAPGFSVDISRVYNSNNTSVGILGQGWSVSFSSKLYDDGSEVTIIMSNGSSASFKKNSNGTYTAKDSRSTLVKSGTSYILTTQDFYKYYYNSSNSLYRMDDPNGNQVNYAFNSAGFVNKITDAAGNVTNITYTTATSTGKISTITDPAGRVTSYYYTSDKLTQVTRPDGSNIYYTYNSNGHLSSVKDNNQQVQESFTYYATVAGKTRLQTLTNTTGNVETYSYDELMNTVTVTTGARTSVTWFDKDLYPVKMQDAEGGITLYEYNIADSANRYGEVTHQQDRNGNDNYYEYDARGNVVKVINPDLSIRLYAYDTNDNLIEETDELGHKTFYTYDSNHNLLKRIKPLDGITAYSTSANQNLYTIENFTYYTTAEAITMCGKAIGGLLKTSTDAAGNTITYTYNAQGNLATSKDSLNRTTTYSFNVLGWLKSETSPMGNSTTYYYDKSGRLVKKTMQGVGSERYVYDLLGNLTQSISAKEYAAVTDNATYTAQNIVSANATNLPNTVGYRYTYTTAGLVATSKDPLNNTTSYTYDTYGNKTKETLPNGLVYNYTYDKLNRITAKSYMESSTSAILEEYAYPLQTDGTSKQTTKVYFSSSESATTAYTYDYAGRLTKTTHPDGGEVNNTYLANGLAASSSDAMGNVTYFEYNPRKQMVKCWSPHDGNLYSLTAWQYDNAGRVTAETNYVGALSKGTTPSGSARITAYTYNIDSSIDEITYNNAGRTSYLYNNDGQISQETSLLTSNRSRRTDYLYNSLGKVTQSTVYQEQKDIDGQADAETLLPIETNYTYDANGNLATITYSNNQSITYGYDAMNRQISESRNMLNENNSTVLVTRTTTYDNMGNVTSTKDERNNIATYVYNNHGFLIRITDAANAVTAREYDLQGRLVKEYSPRALLEDEPGNIIIPPANGIWSDPSSYTAANYTAYAYDGLGRMLSKTLHYRPTYSASVRTVAAEINTYDKNGNLLTTKDALNNITSYTYGNAGRLTVTTDALNKQTQYSYDGLGRLTQQTDARGVATANIYDLFGNITGQTVSGQAVLNATYDYLGNKLSESDANDNTTTYTYSLTGQQRSVTYASGYHVRYWYDVMGNNTRSLDSLDKEVIQTYDSWGRLLIMRQREEGGSQEISRSVRYDVNGNPVYVVDERANATAYAYDKLNRVIETTNALDQTTTITYDANGNKVAEENWLGNTTTYRYDILDRLIAIIDPAGVQIETLTYTDANKQATSADAMDNTTSFSYDALGRLISTTDAESYTTSQTYDANGNITSKTDGAGNITGYSYDNFNRLACVTDANQNTTAFTYDAAGNLLTQTDGNGNTTSYEYDEMNQVVLRADPGGVDGDTYDDSRVEHYSYYANGKLESAQDKNGVITAYTYDIHGRKVEEDVDGAITSYSYDASGNQLTAEDDGGAVTRTYDGLGRVVSKTVPTFGVTTFAYDIVSGLSSGYVGESTTISGRVTIRVYDQAGRLAQVRDGADITSYEYYDNGSLETQTLPNGVTANYTYYDNNKLHTLTNKDGGLTMEAYQYAYDGAGNITAKQDIKGTTAYTYTDLNQLESVEEPSGRLTEYAYDAAGNRQTETVTVDDVITVIHYEVNEQNRLLYTEQAMDSQTVTASYFYDDAGNMLGRSTEAYADAASGAISLGLALTSDGGSEDMSPALYSYNDKNQLIAADTGSGAVANTFNAEGLRVSKTAGDITTYYCYEYSQVIKEVDSEGVEAYNVYGINLISREVDGDKAYYLYNGHGDVTALLSESGTVIASYYYDAFGVVLEADGSFGNSYRYSGYVYDEESGLYNLNARFYDAGLARFLQADTYLGNGADPLSLNLYTYCRNNPLIYWDPTGHVVSATDKKNLTSSQQAAIQKATNDYNKAKAAGDKAGMDKAHANAEAIRNSAGYSGGTTGSGNTPTPPSNGVKVSGVVSGASKSWQPGSSPGTSTIGNLKEGTDYYIASDNRAYFYNNVRTIMESAGANIKYDEKNSTITVTPSLTKPLTSSELVNSILYSNKPLVSGQDFYIGWDGKAHFVDSNFGSAPVSPKPSGPQDSIKSGSREELAKQILDNAQITLLDYHISGKGVGDGANAYQNMVDTMNGLEAKQSNYGKAQGGSAYIDTRVLSGISAITGEHESIRITAIVGSSHSGNSAHYDGLAVDIDKIGGVKISAKRDDVGNVVSSSYSREWYEAFERYAKDELGAVSVMHTFNRPGDHDNHIHIAWR